MNLFPPAQIFIQLITIRENLLKYDKSSDMRLFRILSATPYIIRLRDYAPVQAVSERRTKTNKNSNARELPPTHKSARTLYLHRKEHQDANKRFSEHHAKPLTHNALAKTSRQEALLRIAEKHVSPYGRASFAVQESLFRTSIKPVPHHGRVSPAMRKRLSRKSDP